MLIVGFMCPFPFKSWMSATAYISAPFSPQVQQDPSGFMQLSELSICSSFWVSVSACCNAVPLWLSANIFSLLLNYGWAVLQAQCVALRCLAKAYTQFFLFLVLLNISPCFFNFLAADELRGKQENVLLSRALISHGEKCSQCSINHDGNRCQDCPHTVGSEIST